MIPIQQQLAHSDPGEGHRPEAVKQIIERLMRHYNVESLEALILMQNHHIEKLQNGGLPRVSSDHGAINRQREG